MPVLCSTHRFSAQLWLGIVTGLNENQQRAEVHRPDGGGQQGGEDPVLGGRDGAAVCRDRGDADAVDAGGMSMTDRDKVIKELEDIQKHLDTGYSFAISWKSELIRDVLKLIKELQAEIENWKEAYSFEH